MIGREEVDEQNKGTFDPKSLLSFGPSDNLGRVADADPLTQLINHAK